MLRKKNTKRFIQATAAVLLSVLLSAGCGANGMKEEMPAEGTETAETERKADSVENGNTTAECYYKFTDDAGQEIVLETQPKQVAVLFSSFADVWQIAGGEIAVTVGESVERGFAGENVVLVDDGAGKTIDLERLISSEPDFVICSADITAQSEAAEILTKAGIPCAQFHVESFEKYLSMLKICTDITGNKDAYETYGIQVQKRIAQIREDAKEQSAESKPSILFIRAGSQYSATKAKTAEENFVCQMLKELGTYNIAENAPVLLDGLSFEEVLLENPDYIFISTMGDEAAAKTYMDSVLEEAGWQELDAVKNGNYTYLPKDMFQYKPNARWDEAYQYLADLLK